MGAVRGGQVDFRLLGPVEVRVGDELVELGPAKQRCVLAALAVQVGRPVPIDVLVARVWGDEPPAAARVRCTPISRGCGAPG
jgi:DNA-binding SARP family transcriptional activator